MIADPAADADEAKHLYGIEFASMEEIRDADAVILAVAHEQFKDLKVADLDALYKKEGKKVLLDLKGILNKKDYQSGDYIYWRL